MRRLAAIGAAVALAGLAVAVAPSLLGANPLPAALVAAVGLLALAAGLRAGLSRLRGNADPPDLPSPELRAPAAVPGGEFDDRLDRAARRGVRAAGDRGAVRDALEATAVAVLVRSDGDSPERARERLAAGTWTDDPEAAAFFRPATAPAGPLELLRTTATGDSTFRRRADRAVAALERRIDGDGSSDGGGDGA